MRLATEAPLINRNISWIRNPAGAFGIWDRWVASTGVPVHEGYFVPDMRTIEVGWWEERQCNAAFLKLAGFDGLCEARVTEIPPGPRSTQFAGQLDHLSQCILQDKEPIVSGEEGLRDLRIVEAIYKSAKTKKRIML